MSIKDLLSTGITIEGKVIISVWKEGEKTKEKFIQDFEYQNYFGDYDKSILDLKIKFMYCKDNKLIIEVEE